MAEAMSCRLHRVAPEVPVGDLDVALDYYSDKLGFRTMSVMPDGRYAVVERDDVAIRLFATDRATDQIAFHVFAAGIDGLAAELVARGASLTQPVERKPWGTRDFRVSDPFGNEIKFTEPAG